MQKSNRESSAMTRTCQRVVGDQNTMTTSKDSDDRVAGKRGRLDERQVNTKGVKNRKGR
jgi:hypothetical protein